METTPKIRSLSLDVGWFDIKFDDILVVDIRPNEETQGNHLNFANISSFHVGEEITVANMVENLKSKGIDLSDKITKLISTDFFEKSFIDALGQIYSKAVIIKGRSTNCRSPFVLIRDGFPSDLYLVPPKITFHVAYILAHIFTKEFLNIHNLSRIFIMSEPLVKLDQYDDELIVEYNPCHTKSISTALYTNPYSGGKSTGYLFFAV